MVLLLCRDALHGADAVRHELDRHGRGLDLASVGARMRCSAWSSRRTATRICCWSRRPPGHCARPGRRDRGGDRVAGGAVAAGRVGRHARQPHDPARARRRPTCRACSGRTEPRGGAARTVHLGHRDRLRGREPGVPLPADRPARGPPPGGHRNARPHAAPGARHARAGSVHPADRTRRPVAAPDRGRGAQAPWSTSAPTCSRSTTCTSRINLPLDVLLFPEALDRIDAHRRAFALPAGGC